MGPYAIAAATTLYLITAYSCWRQKDYTHAGLWVSYAAANIFMILHELEKLKNAT